MRTLPIILLVLCTACKEVNYDPHKVIDCSTVDKPVVMAAIIECAKAANPMSDEEGEDLVRQCERTARKTLCTEQNAVIGHAAFGERRGPWVCATARGEPLEACVGFYGGL